MSAIQSESGHCPITEVSVAEIIILLVRVLIQYTKFYEATWYNTNLFLCYGGNSGFQISFREGSKNSGISLLAQDGTKSINQF